MKDYYAAIHPHSGSDGGYVNFMSSDDDHRGPKTMEPTTSDLRP